MVSDDVEGRGEPGPGRDAPGASDGSSPTGGNEAVPDEGGATDARSWAHSSKGTAPKVVDPLLSGQAPKPSERDNPQGERRPRSGVGPGRCPVIGASARVKNGADRRRAVGSATSIRVRRIRGEAVREIARLEAALLLSRQDDLTGAYRRQSGRLALASEIDRARRGDGRFVVAFVDVDDLKGINDRLGHAAGDEALVNVVVAVREHLRSFDPIVRYGGDEFVAGVGGTETAEVERRFGVIAGSLRETHAISISVGLATLTDDDTVDDLMARADEDLYSRRREVR